MAGFENPQYIFQFNASNPSGPLDVKSQGDEHLRGIKLAILQTFPAITGVVSVSHSELNYLAGVTAAVVSNQHKNVANGVPGLDATARILNAQMPTDPSFTTARLLSTVAVDLASAGQAFQIGLSSTLNLAMSAAILQARNNGSGGALGINPFGGAVTIGLTTADGAIVTKVASGIDFYSNGTKYGELGVASGAGYFQVGSPTQRMRMRQSGANSVLENLTTSGSLFFQATNASAALITMGILNPDGTSYMYAGNTPALSWSNGNFSSYGATQSSHYFYSAGVLRARMDALASAFQIVAEAGQTMYLYTYNGTTYIAGIAIDTVGTVYVNNSGSLQALSAYIPAIMQGSPHAFASSAQAWTNVGSVSHTLGQQPRLVQVVARCTSADVGYAIGDEVDILSFYAANSVNGAVGADASSIFWAVSPSNLLNKATGAAGTPNTTRWNIIARAWR